MEPKIESYHATRFRFCWYYILATASILAGAFLIIQSASTLSLGLLGLGILGYALAEIGVRMNLLVVGEHDLTAETGLFSKRTTRIRYSTITDINVTQSFWQRLFGYGTLRIGVPGSSVNQQVTQHFSGKGDVHIEKPRGSVHNGIDLVGFERIRTIEAHLLAKMRKSR